MRSPVSAATAVATKLPPASPEGVARCTLRSEAAEFTRLCDLLCDMVLAAVREHDTEPAPEARPEP